MRSRLKPTDRRDYGLPAAPSHDGVMAWWRSVKTGLAAALHASSDGLRWERSWPHVQFPDLGHGFITTFFVDGDLAIVSGTIEPRGEDSVQESFLQVGTIAP